MAGWWQLGLLIVLLVVCYRPLGDYMAWVFSSERSLRVERAIYRVAGVDPTVEQRWSGYAVSLLAFSALSVLFLYIFQRVQGSLPLSLGFSGVKPALAFNTAASFITNTNWQAYSGESTMGHLTQMSGLAVQNFASAAVGLTVAIALIRGFTRTETGTIGNFWSDLTRGIVRILLPIAFVFAIVLVSQGAIQNFHNFQNVTTLSGQSQAIPGGPVASQESIKELGTNGGGFYNVNSAHPFENPNPFTNLLEIFLLLVIPFSLTGTFGKLAKDRKQGYVLALVMAGLWVTSALVAWHFEAQPNPEVSSVAAGPNMEGKEVRFGIPGSAVFAASTTGTSTGAVDSAHDSFTAFGGAVPLGQHHDVRGHAGRRGHRHVRGPRARRALGVHRRPDGGTNAGVPGQEDRAARDEDGLALHPADARDRSWGWPLWRSRSRRPEVRSSTPDRTGCPRCCTPSRPPRTTTAAPSPASA